MIFPISNLTSTTRRLRLKFISRQESVLWLSQKKGHFIVHKVSTSEHLKKTPHAAYSKLFINIFHAHCKIFVFRLINRRCLVLTDLFDDKNRD